MKNIKIQLHISIFFDFFGSVMALLMVSDSHDKPNISQKNENRVMAKNLNLKPAIEYNAIMRPPTIT